jgi:hypothetical protein
MKRMFWGVLGAAVLMAGCADPVAPTTPTPAVPTVTDTFSDTLLVGGANQHPFTVSTIGGVKVSLPSVEPGAAVIVGLGTQGAAGCSLIDQVLTMAGPNVIMSGTVTVPGTYCVLISDSGNLIEPAVYTINVLHS